MTLPPQGDGPGDQSVPTAGFAPAGDPGLSASGPAPTPTPTPWLTPGWDAPEQAASASPGTPTDAAGPAPVEPGWQAPAGWQPVPPQAVNARRDRLPSVRNVFALILIVAIAFAAGTAFGTSGTGAGLGGAALPQTSASFPPEFAVYEQAWQILHDNYVDPSALDPTTLTYGSISGLLSAVGDTDHTRFLSPQDLANENSSLSGRSSGSAPR